MADTKLDHLAILRGIAEKEGNTPNQIMNALRDIRQIERRAAGELTGEVHDMDRTELQAEIRRIRELIERVHSEE